MILNIEFEISGDARNIFFIWAEIRFGRRSTSVSDRERFKRKEQRNGRRGVKEKPIPVNVGIYLDYLSIFSWGRVSL